jgi:hypothetical protein
MLLVKTLNASTNQPWRFSFFGGDHMISIKNGEQVKGYCQRQAQK